MFNAPNSVPVMHLLNHYFYNFWYETKLSRNASFLNLHSMPHSHCQFRFCLLTQLSTSPGPERLVHVLKILTKPLHIPLPVGFPLFKVIFCSKSWMQSSGCGSPPCLTSLGADLHISSFMFCLLLLWSRSFQAVKEGWAVRGLFPIPVALHGGLSNLVYRLGNEV